MILSTPRLLVPFACLLTLASLCLTAAHAKDGRDFAGVFQVDKVSPQGQDYSLTLSVRVFNYSGADVTNAQVLLHDSVQMTKAYATFSGTAITNRGNIVLKTVQISIPAREYEWWQKHGPPVTIEFQTAEGKSSRESVELLARPVGE